MDVEYKDATEWLEGLPAGAQVLTPDDWVFAKQAGGTWVFRFCPGHVTTAGMIAAHGMPELIDPAVWNEEAGCRQIGGALAYFDPFKRIERRVGEDPEAFQHAREADPDVFVAGLQDKPVRSGHEWGIEWSVYAGPASHCWNGYARIPEGHPWMGQNCGNIPADAPGGVSYGCDQDGWIGFGTMREDTVNEAPSDGSEHDRMVEELCEKLGTPMPEQYEWTCDDVTDMAWELARQIRRASRRGALCFGSL